jgi:hypothetical protein
MKKCKKCNIEYPITDFYKNGIYFKSVCKKCYIDIEVGKGSRRGSTCADCDAGIARRAKRCKSCSINNKRGTAKWFKDKNGYITRTIKTNGIPLSQMQHRDIMEEILGRKLIGKETVHHKNGKRDDNRPENLELWNSNHPSGQRVDDLVKYAIEILKQYAPKCLIDGLQ